jgi:hypothetical protein
MPEFLLIVLLGLPPGPCPADLARRAPALRAAVVAAGLDDGAAGCWFYDKDLWADDWTLLRERWRLYWVLPPLRDADEFPGNREDWTGAIELNRRYYRDCMRCWDCCGPADEWHWRQCCRAADELYAVYDALHTATGTHWSRYSRRKHLAELRQLLGAQDYGRRDLPPCVPWWLMREG